MHIRPLKLPDDFAEVGEMVIEAFQYPENPQWGVQTDEKEQIASSIRTLRRLWPLFRLFSIVSPSMRDMIRGLVAVEAGRIVGVTLLQRRGTTSDWIVGTVGVLPSFRRRGLARQMLESSLDWMVERGAKRTVLGVIDGNVPAQALYERLGFEVFSSLVEFSQKAPEPLPVDPLPAGYALIPLRRSDWRTRLDLDRRITPDHVVRFTPVERGRYRIPLMMRVLQPLMQSLQRERERSFALVRSGGDLVIGRAGYTVSLRGRGVNQIHVRLDPAEPLPAKFLVGRMLDEVVHRSPRLRVEMTVPDWMPEVIAAVEAFGFEERLRYLQMGRSL